MRYSATGAIIWVNPNNRLRGEVLRPDVTSCLF